MRRGAGHPAGNIAGRFIGFLCRQKSNGHCLAELHFVALPQAAIAPHAARAVMLAGCHAFTSSHPLGACHVLPSTQSWSPPVDPAGSTVTINEAGISATGVTFNVDNDIIAPETWTELRPLPSREDRP